jgi:tetratricopeptide (TPR) repeat protein
MVVRPRWLVLCLVACGCHSFPGWEQVQEASTAESLWEQGQAAMSRGEPARAVERYRESLARDPDLVKNHLSLAAAYVELGDPNRACAQLAAYLEAKPEETEVQFYFAELLTRLGRPFEARVEWEQCVQAAQEQGKRARRLLVNCHSRLMELALTQEDSYNAHLHRGIGLYLLARESAALPGAGPELSSEGLLCKAARELALAQGQRPHEARPNWYLYAVRWRLDQPAAARRCLRAAAAAAPFSYLTPFEQRGLYLASQAGEGRLPVK